MRKAVPVFVALLFAVASSSCDIAAPAVAETRTSVESSACSEVRYDCCPNGQVRINNVCVADGPVRVSATWQEAGDMDLYVTTPQGRTIDFRNQMGSGGILDRDDTTGTGPENIYWSSNPPSGTYHVCICRYGDDPGVASVTVKTRGRQTRTVTARPGVRANRLSSPPPCGPDSLFYVLSFTVPGVNGTSDAGVDAGIGQDACPAAPVQECRAETDGGIVDSAVGQDGGTRLDASPGADAEAGLLDSSVGPDAGLDAGSNQDASVVSDSNVAPETSSDAGAGTLIDFTTITGTNASTFGVAGTVRALEFSLTSAVLVSSITVSGLPIGSESSALLWHKTGAVDLQVTDTFPLGTPTSSTSTRSGSTTFAFPVPLRLAVGTQSIVLMVDDSSSGSNWSVRQLDNVGQSLTVGGIVFESVWGWRGDVDTGTNTASSVSIYDPSFFQIPRVVLTLAP